MTLTYKQRLIHTKTAIETSTPTGIDFGLRDKLVETEQTIKMIDGREEGGMRVFLVCTQAEGASFFTTSIFEVHTHPKFGWLGQIMSIKLTAQRNHALSFQDLFMENRHYPRMSDFDFLQRSR